MKTNFKRFAVTGGAGFIGRLVVEELLENPEVSVLIVDNLSVGLPMPQQRPRLMAREIDIRDAEQIEQAFFDFSPEVVVHLAAVHHIPTCELKRAYSLDVNVIGTETILAAAERVNVRRFVLASSGAVYDWKEGPLDEAATPLRPADNYSVAKHTNETQVRLWAERTGAQAVIARIFNTIGRNDPNAHLIPDIVSQIPADRSSVEIALGNLAPCRDYIHVADTSRAIATLASAELFANVDTFNVATGEQLSVGDLVALLGDVMGVRIDVREDPSRKRRIDRPSQLGKTTKIKTLVGFEPRRSLREALADIVATAENRHERKQ